MNNQPKFQWTHHPQECDLCGECVATCEKALKISSLHRIIRNPKQCTECETCSSICDSIYTEFIRSEEDD